ncbi:hypothetical protein [Aneurinibacillus danicus]|jgi:hypothetical protein|uniref:Uncharacterized protein n=1 Tax=Aneurinibacillus danicus TaxID=267746 RepID=A0A511VBA6_9BACL|nr:hypothetical protein [Aneurinibacillus danicus]GEN36114.1 hypothetical protein ADA01nite_35740 [Aneurinibacillus danicus]
MAAQKQQKVGEKIVHTARETLRIAEYARIYSYGYKVIVTNLGCGDAYVGTDNQVVPSPETLLPVGETREFEDTVNAFAYSCPTLEVKLVEK